MTTEKPIISNISSSQRSSVPKIRSAQTALVELVEGVALYALCIAVPALFGIAIKYYENIHQRHALYSSWITEYYDTMLDALYSSLCLDQKTTFSGFKHSVQSASCRFLLWMAHHNGHESNTTTVKEKRFLTDMHMVGMVSCCLAIIRIATFYFLIPEYFAPRQFNAIMRCKSSHVLSSASLRNFVSPKKKAATRSIFKMNNKVNCISEDRKGAIFRVFSSVGSHPEYSDSLTTEKAPEDSDDVYASRESLFSGPQYATSVFRFLFFTSTTIYGWLAFHSAEFWPIYVGGLRGGRTRYCWNLSGNVNYTALDSDFDSKNELLRFYFIIQASYHLQSVCFQILSLFLWLTRANNNTSSSKNLLRSEKITSVRRSMAHYIRPFAEHILATLVIISAFLFSGLRRLGAIGMYAMDLSGLFLQLLQICLNAPNEGPLNILSRPKVVHRVHAFLVVPVFLYCRMFVFPFLVLYSVMLESGEWFHQLENVLPVSGLGYILHRSFCGVIIMMQVLNVIYLRRLLYHPQIGRRAAYHRSNLSQNSIFR